MTTDLTEAEASVLAIIRRQAAGGEPVSTANVRRIALNKKRLTYDQVNRALTRLVRKGYVVKPSRGFYLATVQEQT